MKRVKAWVSAARLRTLPLSISGIIVGSALAYNAGAFRWDICVLALLATLGFQILSNFANDYGDGVKGTDNHERIGPARAMQSGLLTAAQLKKGIIFTALLTCLLSLALIFTAFGSTEFLKSLVFFILGLSAIIAAVKYTVGRGAYGYRGLGDFFVFVFFGLVAVKGTYYMFTQDWNPVVLLPAVTVGLLSVAVLNLNNMRDRQSDARVNKNTLAVIMGEKKVKFYHYALIGIAFLSVLIFFSNTNTWKWSAIALLVFIILIKHVVYVMRNTSPALLDPELKKVALSTFFFSILFAFGFLF
ncbi:MULTISPECIES: 1,4-dihydroxy-2-naphthoate polyprenyltransferase [unclassified Leeuwenhoekiella]|uniref:1,4-dihydroxy-2-naphthoate polyprenyltransferase n=1 Tax=unclassified Leeuwenhoekiella TaxID=2615029 RepID=UPI000C3DD7F9|nr:MULTISPECIES: 1,4-dihydroxy-2-naphthoate polyprenyltransferase [unclassified Leeuwenhoekiella]MAW96714.1 1,4-dihydroxy-2-naphthoate octaprenyltransferase [Leeuwenhoekiella sp.]MBA81603.1 1,4-dihydroxy-2-naphthoate octaprenyltransferase [Leeuwenhoekiella sp.]|tara:strand:- start:44734 stop:45636 length:903 start_codon:yes stop_codon:yes gene_type:complete